MKKPRSQRIVPSIPTLDAWQLALINGGQRPDDSTDVIALGDLWHSGGGYGGGGGGVKRRRRVVGSRLRRRRR